MADTSKKLYGPPLPPKPAGQDKSISKNVIPKASASYGPAFAENPYASTNNERKVNMRVGMGNTNPKEAYAEKPSVTGGMLQTDPLRFIKANPNIPMGQALGYGTDLLRRGLAKGNTGMVRADYVQRLKGSDVFRKLDSTSQGYVLKAYNQWLDSQSAFNPEKARKVESQRQFRQNLDEGANYGF